MWQTGEPKIVEPYSVLAPIYDHVMSHVDYRGWVDFLFTLFQRHNHLPRNILDISCGTGSLMIELIKNGFDPYGVDRSHAMLIQAKKKLKTAGKTHRLIRSDLINLPVKKVFDTVLSTYDSINYINSLNKIASAIHEIMKLVSTGGVFIFDLCTEHNCRAFFDGTAYTSQCGIFEYSRYSYFQKFDKIQFTNFIIKNTKTGETCNERHIQYIYPIEQMYTVLKKTLHHPIYLYKDYTVEPPADERCERVHFYIKKE